MELARPALAEDRQTCTRLLSRALVAAESMRGGTALVGDATPVTLLERWTQPGDGALLPSNWVRPRFRWTGGTGPFKLTLTTARELRGELAPDAAGGARDQPCAPSARHSESSAIASWASSARLVE